MSEQTCVIIGASHAGVSLALQLRREGWEGSIVLVGAESEMPYHRPPLSKEYLAGDKELDAMRLRPEKAFTDNGIELLLGTTALTLDPLEKSVSLDNGETLHYDKLALCTGAGVRTLPLGESLDNVFYLRTAADAALIKEQIGTGKKAVVIGGGYIGLETAAVLANAGVRVTVLEMAERVLQRVTSEVMSGYMRKLHESHGVTIVTGARVHAFEGRANATAIVCNDGSYYDADFVIVGVGVKPNTGLAEAAGLQVDEGIVVDEYTRTSDEHIYAAGDCTLHPSVSYARPLRLESVQNANDQARVAAANICGKQKTYDAIPWFWSDQYDIKLQMAGINADYDEVICRGVPDAKDFKGFALFYLKDSRLIAADCVARPKEFMVSKQLIAGKQRLDKVRLSDESIEPGALLKN